MGADVEDVEAPGDSEHPTIEATINSAKATSQIRRGIVVTGVQVSFRSGESSKRLRRTYAGAQKRDFATKPCNILCLDNTGPSYTTDARQLVNNPFYLTDDRLRNKYAANPVETMSFPAWSGCEFQS